MSGGSNESVLALARKVWEVSFLTSVELNRDCQSAMVVSLELNQVKSLIKVHLREESLFLFLLVLN